MKNIPQPILLLTLMVLSFYWGFSSYKNNTFPYGLIYTQDNGGPLDKVELDATALKTLPYVMGKKISDDENREKDGVVIYDPARAYNGYNLYNSVISETAYLMDMEGDIVHEWHGNGSRGWHHVVLGGDGLLYIVQSKNSILVLDRDSNVVMEKKIRCHHDVQVSDDGTIYVVTEKIETVPELYGDTEVFSDYITILSKDGSVVREIPVIKAINESPFRILLPTFIEGIFHLYGYPHILHLNSIDVLDGSQEPGMGPAFRKGNILFSCREINFIGVLDPETEDVVWGWGGTNIYRQHHASILSDGDILMFDNGQRMSRALEIRPPDGKLVWAYGGTSKEYFFSKTRGAAQRLPNGNTLITVSDDCYAMEVTPDGEVVWKYVNPLKYDNSGTNERAAFYRLQRITFEGDDPFGR